MLGAFCTFSPLKEPHNQFSFRIEYLFSIAAVPNLFGTKDKFRGRQFFHSQGRGWWGMIQTHLLLCSPGLNRPRPVQVCSLEPLSWLHPASPFLTHPPHTSPERQLFGNLSNTGLRLLQRNPSLFVGSQLVKGQHLQPNCLSWKCGSFTC